MSIDDDELRTLGKARNDSITWPYLRVILLLAGAGSLYVNVLLISSASLDLLEDPLYYYARIYGVVVTLFLFLYPLLNWRNKQTELLLKLGSRSVGSAT